MKTSYILIAAFLFVSCGSNKQETEATSTTKIATAVSTNVSFTEKQFANSNITLGSAASRELGTTLRLSGEVDVPPSGLLSVAVPFGGFVKRINLIPGESVRRGQVLAVLAHPEYIELQQDYLDVQTRIEMAQLEYNRQKELAAEKVTGKKTAQQAQTELNLLLNSRAALIQKLRMINIDPSHMKTGQIRETISIISPINGFVKSVNVNLGKMVSPSDVLFELLDNEHLHLKLNAFEKDLPSLTRGQMISFTVQNSGRRHHAQIMQIGSGVEGDKTIPVHADIQDGGSHMIPGMFVTATVKTSNRQVSALPKAAVVEVEGKEYIFVHQGNYQFKRVPVTTGIKTADFTEVVLPDDLVQSDKIVLTGAHNILARELNAGEEE